MRQVFAHLGIVPAWIILMLSLLRRRSKRIDLILSSVLVRVDLVLSSILTSITSLHLSLVFSSTFSMDWNDLTISNIALRTKVRLCNETLSLDFLLLSKLADVLAFTSINSFLHFANELPHFTRQFVPIIVFKWILWPDLGAFEIKRACHLLINFLCATIATLERRLPESEHVIISPLVRRSVLTVNIWDQNHFASLVLLLFLFL